MNTKNTVKKGQLSDPETWVDQYGDYLFRYALSRLQDTSIAEDVVQETFASAFHGRKSFKGESSEKTWFTAILKHKIVDQFRKKSREQIVDDLDGSDESLDELFNKKGKWEIRPSSWTANPAKLIEQKEFLKIFTSCLSKLPERIAQAFKLRELEGQNCDEICNELAITASNCWVMLYRARNALRLCLEKNWFGKETS